MYWSEEEEEEGEVEEEDGVGEAVKVDVEVSITRVAVVRVGRRRKRKGKKDGRRILVVFFGFLFVVLEGGFGRGEEGESGEWVEGRDL